MGWSDSLYWAGAVGATVGLAIFVAPAAIGLIGFGSMGVAAGSYAAAWQSTMGGYVAAGSLFSGLQSVGATGAILSSTKAVAAVGTAAAMGDIAANNPGKDRRHFY